MLFIIILNRIVFFLIIWGERSFFINLGGFLIGLFLVNGFKVLIILDGILGLFLIFLFKILSCVLVIVFLVMLVIIYLYCLELLGVMFLRISKEEFGSVLMFMFLLFLEIFLLFRNYFIFGFGLLMYFIENFIVLLVFVVES